jgi:glycosyltransferase involved in cell wall biosynthesis
LYADPSDRELAKLGYPIRKFVEPRARQLTYLLSDAFGVKLVEPFPEEDILIAPSYSLALLHTSKSFAFTLHDLQDFHYPQNFSWVQRAWRRRIHRRLAVRATEIICESRYVKFDIVRIFDVPEEKVSVLAAPPLRESQVDFSAEALAAVRERLNLPARFVFYPAQFWPHKNHLQLVMAFKQVVAREPHLKLVLTGRKRDEFEVVMAAATQAGLETKIQHVGYIDQADLQATYRLATALVMPSLFESISIPIYEAFQAGTPVAASGILSIPEQVGEAALLFDPFSASSIADSILRIVNDRPLAESLAKRGQEKLALITPEHYGTQLKRLLDQL